MLKMFASYVMFSVVVSNKTTKGDQWNNKEQIISLYLFPKITDYLILKSSNFFGIDIKID